MSHLILKYTITFDFHYCLCNYCNDVSILFMVNSSQFATVTLFFMQVFHFMSALEAVLLWKKDMYLSMYECIMYFKANYML